VTKNFGAENASVPLDKPRTNGFFREDSGGKYLAYWVESPGIAL